MLETYAQAMSTTAEALHEVALPRRELTWEDLQAVPDDGYWAYEC